MLPLIGSKPICCLHPYRRQKDAKGNGVDLSTYKGKVLQIVNVASRCELTNSNYMELSQLYEKYKRNDFEILTFPCIQLNSPALILKPVSQSSRLM
ncbi:probable phospholipid hydroperoxide glutathione peroxidase 6, mitochondrial [Musa acuminata AAA Group]|uniref:probable phospholipid hydroperoxide glutathione peroxidase 6, mitochondrial n=1 Tax=Musa acuminata AAA Group TaxID=214697 RepID=UPI0031CEFE82